MRKGFVVFSLSILMSEKGMTRGWFQTRGK
jgi:hypothetical protein